MLLPFSSIWSACQKCHSHIIAWLTIIIICSSIIKCQLSERNLSSEHRKNGLVWLWPAHFASHIFLSLSPYTPVLNGGNWLILFAFAFCSIEIGQECIWHSGVHHTIGGNAAFTSQIPTHTSISMERLARPHSNVNYGHIYKWCQYNQWQ